MTNRFNEHFILKSQYSKEIDSLRKRFRGVWEQSQFWCFACAENGARTLPSPFFYSFHFSRCVSLLPNPTETLPTRAKKLTSFHSALKSLHFVLKSSIRKKL